jgi:hypothetical protein
LTQSKVEYIREAAESDLVVFIQLLAPYIHLGDVHKELGGWLTRKGGLKNKLVLLPRGHMKSRLVAFLAAWWITKNPSETILYVSSYADLAEAQLYLIKNIIDNPIYRRYWPEMIHADEGKRSRWTTSEIIVDHPMRAGEGTRDPTVKAIGITGGTTGFHATKVILDDVVEPRNAYTEDGRNKVAALYSQLASIEEPEAEEVVVGTRYHPTDLYNTLINMTETSFNAEGEEEEEPVYEVFQRVVETDGEFLWPRSARKDGKPFGFDAKILARVKAKYVDFTQFYAQYYNDPNHASLQSIDNTAFQYYDKKHLKQEGDVWYFKGDKLNLTAALDFAFSLRKKADSTAIAVVGTDAKNNNYILDILRFKTDKISEYFKNMLHMYDKWNVRKWRCEVTVAQQAIVRELKEQYIKPMGIPITIDEYRPSRHEGDKAERIDAILGHRYENKQIWHYRGGNTQLLEEELVMRNPAHDDIKDAVANAIAIATPSRQRHLTPVSNIIQYNSRFGGIA